MINFINKIVVVILGLSINHAWAACPELKGNYACETSRGVTDLEFNQEEVESKTVYTILDASGEYKLLTDGLEYPYEIPENNETGSVRGTCENDMLNSYIQGKVKNSEGKVVANWTVQQTFKLDTDKNMMISTTGSQFVSGEDKVIQENYLCKRK